MAKKSSHQGFGPPPNNHDGSQNSNPTPQTKREKFSLRKSIAKAQEAVQGLQLRAEASQGKSINKIAIIGGAGFLAVLVLVLGVSGLSAQPQRASDESKPLMSDPARPEMAQGAVRDLPQSYDDAARLGRISAQASEIPQLGPAMAGDIVAFAPNNYGTPNYDMGVDPIAAGIRTRAPGATNGAYTQSYQPAAQYASSAQTDELETARKSGLFFGLRDKSGPAMAANPISDLESADRDLMTSPHKVLPAASARSLHPGSIIPASLLTAINSDTPGPVVAQITEAIYDSTTGDQLLIPQGAKLIGAYKASAQYGQRRISIIWSRLVFPDGSQIVLNELAADASGAAGLKGRVDDHWGAAFSAAALGTLINVGAASTQDRNSIGVTYSGIGIINGDEPVEDAARQGVQRTASTLSNRIIDRGLSVAPTIRVGAGARISVLVTRELDL